MTLDNKPNSDPTILVVCIPMLFKQDLHRGQIHLHSNGLVVTTTYNGITLDGLIYDVATTHPCMCCL